MRTSLIWKSCICLIKCREHDDIIGFRNGEHPFLFISFANVPVQKEELFRLSLLITIKPGGRNDMSDREEIVRCYEAMYDGEIRRDIPYLKKYPDESCVLIHMNGIKMNRQEYFDAVMDGTLNYYRCRHEHEDVRIDGNYAFMGGDTKVEAVV